MTQARWASNLHSPHFIRGITLCTMKTSGSSNLLVQDDPQRIVFVSFKSWRTVREKFGTRVVFTYSLRYLRFQWDIDFSCNDMIGLSRILYPLFEIRIPNTRSPARFNKIFYKRDQESLTQVSMMMQKYLQDLLDIQSAIVMTHRTMREFLSISAVSFNQDMGRKGKEGWLKKCPGGYGEGPSRRIGDYVRVWMWRWVVLHDTYLSWYKGPQDIVPRKILHLDKDFRVAVAGRVLTIITGARRLLLKASTHRAAEEWATSITEFYTNSARTTEHEFGSAYPQHTNCDVKVYTYTRDYFNSLAIALLSAQKEILITSWIHSPTLLLTRPPYPTLRLDQILKYKADQGVKICILLYKEVEHAGLDHDSLGSKTYLESMSPNISCIRHPNKVTGSSTAVMWSHHEKSVIVDRNLCFIGGVDLAFTRWDDEKHRVADEEGTIYPGPDYHNPAPDLFHPLRESVLPSPLPPPGDAPTCAAAPIVDYTSEEEGDNELEPRDLYPRMPWHDVQASVSGLTARDCASHFVQRWNHHRLSASHASKPVLFDITDNPNYGVCARCLTEGLSETLTKCANCGHDLGPSSTYSVETNIALCPLVLEGYSYIVFECSYPGTQPLPFNVYGDCPVVVADVGQNSNEDTTGSIPADPASSSLHKDIRSVKNVSEGVLLDAQGAQAKQLQAHGLTPTIGDVVIAVDASVVTQLNAKQLKRLVRMKRIENGTFLTGTTQSEPNMRITFRRHFVEVVQEANTPFKCDDRVLAPVLTPTSCAPLCMPLCAPVTQLATGAEAPSQSLLINVDECQEQLAPPACLAAARIEVNLAMSTLFHTPYPSIETLPRVWDGSGTCKVQLLRSIGKWSTGANTECSILNCYVETVASAKHFIYIENQFFIGSTAGEGVSNGIPAAITNRILQAHQNKEAFRVIVVVPIHPDDDFVNAFIPKAVMNYQYLTINRGVHSMFAQLRQQAPDITISDYITFHSLRNWGVINHKVVSEQVYVHAKLMVVDDRIAIIGSANFNDRSMLGHRDSELALRIEDTQQVSSVMAGQSCTVGFFPHSLRMRLMHQHLGDDGTLDLSDPLNAANGALWMERTNRNSAIYDQIDGDLSVYRCTTVPQYTEALTGYANSSYQDPEVKRTLAEIKGFLVNWPLTLFEKEDLSPPLATRLLVPNDMWV